LQLSPDFPKTTRGKRGELSKELEMKRKILLWATFILAFCVVNSFGQTTNLEGQILDQDGAAIAGANVVLKQTASSFERIASSGETGEFRFEKLPAGTFEIIVIARGFDSYQKPEMRSE
jgi:hypothetical protein